MRRLARHLFSLCSAVSLLLCVAVCARWLGRPSWVSGFEMTLSETVRPLTAAEMRLPGNGVGYLDCEVAGVTLRRSTLFLHGDGHDPVHGGASVRFLNGNGLDVTSLAIPHWLLAGFLAVGPVIWLGHQHRRIVRLEREAAGRCLRCGYDLRASPGRCPECGTLAAK